MKRALITYLCLGAASEAVIILMARGWVRESLLLLNYQQSKGREVTITFAAEMAPTILLIALIVPLTLILLALAYAIGRLRDDNAAIHALGISIIVCAIIVMWSQVVATMPWIGGVITGMNDLEAQQQVEQSGTDNHNQND